MSISPSQRRLLIAGGTIAVLGILAAVLLPALARPSNDGGNSAALAACRSVYVCFHLVASEHGDSAVSIADFTASDRAYFRQVAGLSWIPDSKVMVTSESVRIGEGAARNVIAVCDTAFDNVPQRTFGRAPPTHAVVYADGSTGLLSIDDFQRLDLRGFVDVRTLQNGKVEQEGGANGSQPSRSEASSTSAAAGSRRSP